jgi:hypothetical protein
MNVNCGWKLEFKFWFKRQTEFDRVEGRGHTYKIYFNHYYIWQSFKYGDGAKYCYVGTNYEILYGRIL